MLEQDPKEEAEDEYQVEIQAKDEAKVANNSDNVSEKSDATCEKLDMSLEDESGSTKPFDSAQFVTEELDRTPESISNDDTSESVSANEASNPPKLVNGHKLDVDNEEMDVKVCQGIVCLGYNWL